jgi:hypothetical protein
MPLHAVQDSPRNNPMPDTYEEDIEKFLDDIFDGVKIIPTDRSSAVAGAKQPDSSKPSPTVENVLSSNVETRVGLIKSQKQTCKVCGLSLLNY